MSEPLANYLFMPWFRQGLAAKIVGESAVTSHRAGFQVMLQVNELRNEQITKPVELYGPGDVINFDHRVVVRTDPKRDVGDFEPNYFPQIEFTQPDFPWRYSPVAVDGNDPLRLPPWICLIVLREQEFGPPDPGILQASSTNREQTLPSAITVNSQKKSLPDLAQSWAWAHVQLTVKEDELQDLVTDIQANDLEGLRQIIRDEPERAVSRLVCPRRLEAGVLYRAFVVPTFENGRRAGLRQEIEAGRTDPAWDTNKNEPITLPYYYDWEFRTGLRGDFESLVRLLESRQLDKESGVGLRDMDCEKPGYDRPPVERSDLPPDDPRRHVMALEGALTTVDAIPDPKAWPHPEDQPGGFRDKLIELLKLPEDQIESGRDEHWVVPPIYGRWHAERRRLPAESRAWLNALNLDPRYRVVAGFGTLAVQQEQEKLMAEAWRQIGAVNEANEQLRQAQLGCAASQKLFQRHLGNLPHADFIRLTRPVHSRVLAEVESPDGDNTKVTVQQQIKKSPIPAAAMEPAFRRVARRRGPLRRKRQQPDADRDREDILERLNKGEVAAAGLLSSPHGAPGMGDISDSRRPSWASGPLWPWLKRLHWILLVLAALLHVVVGVLFALGVSISPSHPLVVAASALLVLAALIGRRLITPGLIAENVQEQNLTPESVRSMPGRPDFVLDSPGSDFSPGATGEQDSEAARVFRGFAQQMQAFLSPALAPEEDLTPIDTRAVRGALIDALNPRKTIQAKMKKRLHLGDVLRGVEGLETIMGAPEFHQPMYEPLREQWPDLLLPGVGKIEQNTVTLLKTNPRFVKAYHVGLNHEFARELLWREYPTDQRGSYFRQFWDVSNFVPPESLLKELEDEAKARHGDIWEMMPQAKREMEVASLLRERLKDIPPIHSWRNTDLGQASSRATDSLREKLVLLVRGDLLKKYPTAVIYASKADWNKTKTSVGHFSTMNRSTEEIRCWAAPCPRTSPSSDLRWRRKRRGARWNRLALILKTWGGSS
ncbi:hypothetical protein [Petrachloros mirabilis]